MSRVPLNKQGEIDMFQDILAMGSGGGSMPTIEIFEQECYSAPVSKQCTSALIEVGTKTYEREYIGKLENGTVTDEYNASNRFTTSYNNGTFTISGGLNANYAWVSIMYV